MDAIFRGRRLRIVRRTPDTVWLELPAPAIDPPPPIRVPPSDRYLILNPTDEDLELAEAYERGRIKVFEYRDGHTHPPGHEIGRFRGGRRSF